ncbi:MAG: hypothetical protein OEQ53_01625 [Saprospiraceae bacterium]|nr:hypothetical protein [Saprospiraceae bacterium]
MNMYLSKWIVIPLLGLVGVVLLVCYVFDFPEYSYLLIPLSIAVAVVYVLHPEIDRWYLKRYPQGLSKGLVRFVNDHMPLYGSLNQEQRIAFESRISTFMKSADFMPQGFDNIPEDLKAVVSINAYRLTAFRPKWHSRFDEFQNIVIYHHPFPSPQFPENLHSSELFVQDHVLIFCGDHFMKAFRFPQEYFNTAMYEWAKVVMLYDMPEFKIEVDKFQEVSGFKNEDVVEYIGLPEPYINWDAVAVTYFFIFPVRYKMYLGTSYDAMASYFGVDPMALFATKM